MQVLVLGGTQFVGRQIVETLLAVGHRVTIFNRGKTADEFPVEVERLRGDRDDGKRGLAALNDRHWDDCVDVSGYTPRQVRASAELLRTNVTRYVYMSAVSVYGEPRDRPVLETHPRMPPANDEAEVVDQESYGRCKVACEDIVEEVYGNRATVLRPQVIVGPHDQYGRFAYWVHRVMHPGPMLAPGDGSDHFQVIDVRDVARFVTTVIEKDLPGTFNLAGPRITWSQFMQLLGPQNVVWVSAEILKSAGVTENDVPLFRAKNHPRSGLMHVSNERAIAAGLTLTKPIDTINHARALIIEKYLTDGLSPERETELIQLAHHS